jgi:uncharacterized protein
MRKLTAICCLTLAVVLGSAGVSWSADIQKGLDAFYSGDYATTLREWKLLAEQGNADAQYKLGLMYDKRQRISKDYKTSVKFWRRLAAEQGNAHAQHNLGWLYQQGKGVPKNNKIAAKWWALAANQGLANAQFYKGLLYLFSLREIQDIVFSRLFDIISASRGFGIYDNAAYWYLLAAEQGHADAQSNLGVMYHQGKVIPHDDKTAAKWYTFAAEKGVFSAQFNLANMYDRGQGVLQDDVYAHMWFNIAASSGTANAARNRERVAKRMTPSQLEKAQDFARKCVRKKYKGC